MMNKLLTLVTIVALTMVCSSQLGSTTLGTKVLKKQVEAKELEQTKGNNITYAQDKNNQVSCLSQIHQTILPRVNGVPDIILTEINGGLEDEVSANFTYQQYSWTVAFSNLSLGGDSYTWWIDGISSNELNPVHTFTSPGTYVVCLFVTDSVSGEADAFCDEVVIECPYSAAFSIISNDYTISVQSQEAGLENYEWTISDGSVYNGFSALHIFDIAGDYDICLTVNDDESGCTATNCQTVSIPLVTLNNVIADFSFTTNGQTVSFNNTSEGANFYIWSFEYGVTQQEENPSYTFSSDGTYEVCLFAFNTEESALDVICQEIAIVCNTQAAFDYSAQGLEVTFENTSTDATNYIWSLTNSIDLYQPNPTFTFPSPGTFYVCLHAVNLFTGCDSDICLPITVVEDPCNNTPTFNFSSNGYLGFYQLDNPEDYDSIVWDFNDGTTSNEPSGTHQYHSAGNYNYQLILTKDDCSFHYNGIVSIQDLEIACESPEVKCLDINYIFVNSCSSPEKFNEAAAFKVGQNSLEIDELTVQWGRITNSWLGVCANSQTSTIVADINATIENGGQIIEPTGGILPAYSEVLLLSSTEFNHFAFDFSDLNRDIYVIFQCTGNPSGHFLNLVPNDALYNGVQSFAISYNSPILGCNDEVSFTNEHLLTGGDGDYVLFDSEGNPTGGNDGCVFFSSNQAIPPSTDFSWSSTDLAITFTNTTTNFYTGSEWHFGDGSSSFSNTPIHTYEYPGIYLVELLVYTNENICESITKEVTVGDPNLCSINPNFDFTIEGQIVQFTNLTTGIYTHQAWNFGDGEVSTEEHPNHMYELPATGDGYFVCLSVQNSDLSDCVEIICKEVPIAEFAAPLRLTTEPNSAKINQQSTSESISNCKLEMSFDYEVNGLNVLFTTTSSHNFTNIVWAFEKDNQTANEPNPSFTFKEAGEHSFTVEIWGKNRDCRSSFKGSIFLFEN